MLNAEDNSRNTVAARDNPASSYQCGRRVIGSACERGPDHLGRCCQSAKEDQCIPRPSSWLSRRVVGLNLAILTGAALLACLAIPSKEKIFRPGGLSKPHKQILGNRIISQRCNMCHPNSHQKSLGVTQDELCLNCHQEHLPNAERQLAHDLSSEQLISLVGREADAPELSDLMNTKCAYCHREHHGGDTDIKAITDARCQACHQVRYSDFESSHPQFASYPYRVPRKISFDHAAHEAQHFAKKGKSLDCKACHVVEKQGSTEPVLRTKSFEQSCAECHQETIESSMVEGWAFLQIPSLEESVLKEHSSRLGSWPEMARYGMDGEITLPMRFLLQADPEVARALDAFGESTKLSEWLIDSEVAEKQVVTVAAGIKELLGEIASQGQKACRDRLARVLSLELNRPPSKQETELIEKMVAGLPPDVFQLAVENWFAGRKQIASQDRAQRMRLTATQDLLTGDDDLLFSDDDLLGAGDRLDSGIGLESDQSRAQERSASFKPFERSGSQLALGGWFVDKSVLTLVYRPTGHADSTLAAWLQFALLIERGNLETSKDSHTKLKFGQVIPGNCSECHVLTPGSAEFSSWQVGSREPSVRLFTKFDHRPHLTLPSLSDCKHCHQYSRHGDQSSQQRFHISGMISQLKDSTATRQTPTLTSVHARLRTALESEFQLMEKSQCVACHNKAGASSGCTQCHNYHVGDEGLRWSQMRRLLMTGPSGESHSKQ